MLLQATIACILLAGCMGTPSHPQTLLPGAGPYRLPVDTFPINSPVATTGCGQAPSIPQGTSVDMTIAAHPAEALGNRTRSYLLHLPKHYNNAISYPVILIFHGFGGTAAGMERGSAFSTLADAQGFIAVYPQGLPQPHTDKPFWAEIGPIDYGVDDVLFVSDILNDLQQKFCVDAHRLYATGFSNGGGLTTLLACRLAGRVAAFAPISGNDYSIPGGCHPGRPVALLNMHGSADPLLPYNGTPPGSSPDWPLPSLPQYLRAWAARDGCATGPVIFL
ncbi:MAG TPA: PHB depolymerase family esterase, partial [Ktedonobacteraceae bacterium]|nr:PHB depolymerase family esterase [Ktedonobacteraceae bacterium]